MAYISQNNMNSKVAIYTRVSTRDQSPEMQLRDLRKYSLQRGFEVYQEYVDIGISGTKSKRPALDEMMEGARKREFDTVLVWRFDRFARSTQHLVNALQEFRNLGIDFISFQENIDTSSPMGEAMFTIIAAIAKLERDIISERVQGGLRKARESGKILGRPKARIDVRKIKKLKSEGMSIREIAKQTTYVDRNGRKRKASKSVIDRILRQNN